MVDCYDNIIITLCKLYHSQHDPVHQPSICDVITLFGEDIITLCSQSGHRSCCQTHGIYIQNEHTHTPVLYICRSVCNKWNTNIRTLFILNATAIFQILVMLLLIEKE